MSIELPIRFVNYTLPPPRGYHCGECGAEGVKLWRKYNTFLEHQRLLCAACALKDQGKEGPIDELGKRDDGYARTDQIGWLIPAVPTEDGSTFWGYTSVPNDGCEWWRGLPTHAEDSNQRFERLAIEFHRETGALAPGKDSRIPLPHTDAERWAMWKEWLAERKDQSQ